MSIEAQRERAQHPLQSKLHPTYARTLALLLLASLAGLNAGSAAQEKKKRPLEMVITGTVFTEIGFSLAGAAIQVNRAGERKARWEATSDRRGEFGVRVPQGSEYEVRVNAKGYEEQTQKVDGKSSAYENLVFRMKPETGRKKP